MCKKNLEATGLFVNFSKAFGSIHTANITDIWFPQRNCYHYNDALQKHDESNGLLTWWWNRHLQYCHRNWQWFYILKTLVVLIKKMVSHEKTTNKKQTISHRNNHRYRISRWSSAASKYTCPSWISVA